MIVSFASRALAAFMLLSVSGLVGCAEKHGARSTGEGDPPAPDAHSLRQLVHDVFSALQHDAELRCPCYVAAGDYPSQEACLAEVGRGSRSIECVEDSLGELEGETLRDSLACTLELREATNACLEVTSCDEQLTRCYETVNDCPMADPMLLTRAARACPGAFGVLR